jgi:hypothetical protein
VVLGGADGAEVVDDVADGHAHQAPDVGADAGAVVVGTLGVHPEGDPLGAAVVFDAGVDAVAVGADAVPGLGDVLGLQDLDLDLERHGEPGGQGAPAAADS